VLEATTIEVTGADADGSVGLLTAIADPVRWRLLDELARRGTMCVCDLKPIGGVASNVLSYHLKVLREARLVTAAKRGRWVDYTITDDAADRLAAALPGRPGGGP
jgi:ArsR family transcriptional regulator